VFILALFVVSVMFFHVNATKSHDYLFFFLAGLVELGVDPLEGVELNLDVLPVYYYEG
jgi:4-amino-4-deoxy-L-arabinose transferase-like glycosyltransferase